MFGMMVRILDSDTLQVGSPITGVVVKIVLKLDVLITQMEDGTILAVIKCRTLSARDLLEMLLKFNNFKKN